MKKNILKMSFIAAVAVASGYIAYAQSQKAEALPDLAMNNVEALASGEGSCPHGCKQGRGGCQCNGWHSQWRDADYSWGV